MEYPSGQSRNPTAVHDNSLTPVPGPPIGGFVLRGRPSRCTQRGSCCSRRRSRSRTSGKGRPAIYRRRASISPRSANRCNRFVRVRSSPGACGPRSNRTVSSARSSGSSSRRSSGISWHFIPDARSTDVGSGVAPSPPLLLLSEPSNRDRSERTGFDLRRARRRLKIVFRVLASSRGGVARKGSTKPSVRQAIELASDSPDERDAQEIPDKVAETGDARPLADVQPTPKAPGIVTQTAAATPALDDKAAIAADSWVQTGFRLTSPASRLNACALRACTRDLGIDRDPHSPSYVISPRSGGLVTFRSSASADRDWDFALRVAI